MTGIFCKNFLPLLLLSCLFQVNTGYSGDSRKYFSSIADSTDTIDSSKADYDGPYILYNYGTATIKQVLEKDNIPYAVEEKYTSSIKGKIITCNIDDSLSFNATIKDTLTNESSVYEMPEKLIAISDIEGNFIPLRDFLINNKIINSSNQWIFGKGHLVLNGDMFDRGLHVTECLWFIYHLEQEAVKYGGQVHFILGNHEIMNLNDDLRYVRNKYIETAKLLIEDYRNFYKMNTELGRWLATKNKVEKIGPYLFLHGGISEGMDSLNASLEEINIKARDNYFNSKSAKQSSDKLVSTIYNSKTSPFWYRGYVNGTIKEEDLDQILTNFGISKIVVGHTIVDDVKYFYNRKIIGIDTDHAEGDTEGLLIEGGNEYKVDKAGNRILMK